MLKTVKLLFAVLLTNLFACSNQSNPSNSNEESRLGLFWSYDTGFSSAFLGEPLQLDNFVFISGGLGLHKVSFEDGNRIWFTPVEGTESSLMSERFITNETTIIATKPKVIYGFDVNSGNVKWEIVVPDSMDLLPIGMGARFNESAYYTSTLGYIFDVNINSGTLNHIYKFPFKIRNINVFDNGDLLIPHEDVHSEDPFVFTAVMGRWRPSTKEWIWKYKLDGAGSFSVRYPQIENDIVYSGLRGAGFVAINATTGEEIWKNIDISLVSEFHVLTPDTIFISAISFLYALDRHTGELLWKSESLGVAEGTRIHYKNGYVYWGHNNGIYVYDAKTGKQVLYQRPEFGGYIWTSAMAEDRYFVQTGTHLLAYELYQPEN